MVGTWHSCRMKDTSACKCAHLDADAHRHRHAFHRTAKGVSLSISFPISSPPTTHPTRSALSIELQGEKHHNRGYMQIAWRDSSRHEDANATRVSFKIYTGPVGVMVVQRDPASFCPTTKYHAGATPASIKMQTGPVRFMLGRQTNMQPDIPCPGLTPPSTLTPAQLASNPRTNAHPRKTLHIHTHLWASRASHHL